MKFNIKRSLLDLTLQNVSRGLSNKTPMPVMMGINIIATNDTLTFITTNKEISVKIVLTSSEDLIIYEQGNCVVPGKYFVDIVKKIDGEKVDFTLFDESTIKIIGSSSDFTLVALDKTNFPNPNFDKENDPISISSKELKQIIKQTTFACATSETRIILTSLNFTLENNVLKLIATDSFRLANKTTTVDYNNKRLQMNVPSKSLDELAKILTDSSEALQVYISSDNAIFVYKNIEFMTRLVEGTFPNVGGLSIDNPISVITFNRTTLISAIDRASLFLETGEMNYVKFSFNENNDVVEISSNSTEIGRVVETINPIKKDLKQSLLLAFNAKFLIEALKAFDTETISFYLRTDIKPLIMKSDEDNSLIQLLIPIRAF